MFRRTRPLVLAAAAALALGTACQGNTAAEGETEPAADTDAAAADAAADEVTKVDVPMPMTATGPVATVDGEPVPAEQFNDLIERIVNAARGQLPAHMVDQVKGRTLSQSVDMYLIDQAVEADGIEVTDAELAAELERFKSGMPEGMTMASFLKDRNLTRAEFEEDVRKSLAVEELLRKRQGIEVTEAEAREFYDKNAARFSQPEQVQASHILIKTEEGASEEQIAEARAKATAIAEEARKPGADFAALAKDKSEGPSAPRGGDLGFFPKERMVPEFSEAAFAMEDGAISDPVQTKFGFHVIKRTGHKPAETTSFDEAKDDIIRQLEGRQMQQAMGEVVKALREGKEIVEKPEAIQVNEDALAPAAMPGMGGPGGPGGAGGANAELQKQIQEQIRKMQEERAKQGGGEAPATPPE